MCVCVCLIHWWGWLLAFFGAGSCLFFCELYKFISKQYVGEAEMADEITKTMPVRRCKLSTTTPA